MITKYTAGSSAKDLLDYLLDKDRKGHSEAAIFDTNIGDGTPEGILLALDTLAQGNPQVTNTIGHLVLSFQPEEHCLDDPALRFIAEEYLHLIGIPNPRFVAVRHREGLHIAFSLVDDDGQRLDAWHILKDAQAAVYTLASKYHLTCPYPKPGFKLPKLERAELEHAERNAERYGTTCPRLMLAIAIILALEPGLRTPETFASNLKKLHVTVYYHRDQRGAINGATFALDNYRGDMTPTLKGSQIAPCYSWHHIRHALSLACHTDHLEPIRSLLLDQLPDRKLPEHHETPTAPSQEQPERRLDPAHGTADRSEHHRSPAPTDGRAPASGPAQPPQPPDSTQTPTLTLPQPPPRRGRSH